jgi:translation initiation factor 3 subunit G
LKQRWNRTQTETRTTPENRTATSNKQQTTTNNSSSKLKEHLLEQTNKTESTIIIMSKVRWGDDLDDSDDDEPEVSKSGGSRGGAPPAASVGTAGFGKHQPTPPTHYSRIDSHGIQIVTSYKPGGRLPGQIIKTVTKQRVEIVAMREPKVVQERARTWKKFGTALQDEKDGNATTVQSKDEILLEDPHADLDLQDEDPASAISTNLNAFWAKQKRRELERKYEVGGSDPNSADIGDEDGGGGGGWTQVRGSAGEGGGGGLASMGGSSGRYVPPSQRGGAAGSAAGGPGMGSFKPQARTDDLNTIRVTNLSENTTEADLQELFQRFGRISRVYLAKHKETLTSRGFAFVTFVNKDDAAKAMDALQGFGYDHLILKLEWAKPNTPKDPGASGTEFRSGYGKALAQDTKEKVSFASNLTK